MKKENLRWDILGRTPSPRYKEVTMKPNMSFPSRRAAWVVLLAAAFVALSVFSAMGQQGQPQAPAPGKSTNLVNINTADAQQLQALPGIGPAISERIVQYRQTHGPFKTKEDIKNVQGIGDKKFEAIKDLITVK